MMIRPLSLYIGLRYTRAKRRSHFISFIALASMLGIALGVMVLIVVLSVMNGFDYQIRERFFAIAPEVTAVSEGDIVPEWPKIVEQLAQYPEIRGVSPYVNGKGMLIYQGKIEGVQVVGILPQEEGKVSKISHMLIEGKLSSLQPGHYNMVMGLALAQRLGLQLGDQINLLTPQANTTLLGVFPRYRRFTLSGIFHTGDGFGFETDLVYINMRDAGLLFGDQQATNGFYVKLKNLYKAPEVTRQLQDILPTRYSVTNWTEQFGAFFQALAMEKTMLFVILLLIVGVAAFNLVSSLVMAVNDKRSDIAILRTLGASPGVIMRTIMIQGALIGLIGTLVGLLLGVLLALHVTEITNAIQNFFGIKFLQSSVYFVDFLPSRLQLSDLLKVCLTAFLLSIVATLYPAWLAFRTQPAEALRYE